MSIIKKIESLLRTKEEFTSADGEILSNRVYDAAVNLSHSLLYVLMSDDAWKEQFLLQLSTIAKVEQISDKKSFRVVGFHFYNQQYRAGSLDRDIKDILKG